jgi:hypothetical protein
MKFFDLKDYYTTNFSLLNLGSLTLNDLEEMMFWEREIYTNIAAEYNKKMKENLAENGMGGMYE